MHRCSCQCFTLGWTFAGWRGPSHASDGKPPEVFAPPRAYGFVNAVARRRGPPTICAALRAVKWTSHLHIPCCAAVDAVACWLVSHAGDRAALLALPFSAQAA